MNQIPKNLTISSQQLSEDISQKTPMLIFDLRAQDEFEKSHVAGSVHAVCDAQAKEKIMPKIPKNTKIVLISEPEQISKEVAAMMAEFGLDAYYLQGGFGAWKGSLGKGQTGKFITPDELISKLDSVYLLDVRDYEEFSEYQIPGSINIPLDQLFDQKTMEKIPKDKEVVTICPHGNRAMVASFALARGGIYSSTLQGGLTQWNQVLKPVSVVKEPVQVIQVQKVGKGCLSHIVESNGEAIVIDPLYPIEKYIEVAKKSRIQNYQSF